MPTGYQVIVRPARIKEGQPGYFVNSEGSRGELPQYPAMSRERAVASIRSRFGRSDVPFEVTGPEGSPQIVALSAFKAMFVE